MEYLFPIFILECLAYKLLEKTAYAVNFIKVQVGGGVKTCGFLAWQVDIYEHKAM